MHSWLWPWFCSCRWKLTNKMIHTWMQIKHAYTFSVCSMGQPRCKKWTSSRCVLHLHALLFDMMFTNTLSASQQKPIMFHFLDVTRVNRPPMTHEVKTNDWGDSHQFYLLLFSEDKDLWMQSTSSVLKHNLARSTSHSFSLNNWAVFRSHSFISNLAAFFFSQSSPLKRRRQDAHAKKIHQSETFTPKRNDISLSQTQSQGWETWRQGE